jgi:hypothetical protein
VEYISAIVTASESDAIKEAYGFLSGTMGQTKMSNDQRMHTYSQDHLGTDVNIPLMESKQMTMEASEGEVSTTLMVPVTKAKAPIEVDTGSLPEHVYREALVQGLKVLINRGMTKLTKEAYPDADQLKEAAMDKATETLQNMYDGKIRIMGGAKSDKVPREVMTEARRIARALVKDGLKRAGVKISYVESSEITKAANVLLADQPAILEQAKEEVERRQKAAAKVTIDVKAIPISEKRKAAAEASAAAKKADKTLSAAKAGKVATRARPGLNA